MQAIENHSNKKGLTALFVSTVVLFVFVAAPRFQVTSTSSISGTMTREVAQAQDAVNRVLLESGISFKEGLLAYVDDDRQMAGEKFNKSVEVFLYSTLNIQGQQKLQACYNQLIETIYRIEFPLEAQLPEVRNLALTCDWNIDLALSDTVALAVRQSTIKPYGPPSTTVAVTDAGVAKAMKVGFNTIEFEPSPLDELASSKLVVDEEKRQGEFISDKRSYSTPLRIVKAKAGDTVAKLAARNNLDAAEVAKLNGLFPNSVLGAGREIRLPNLFSYVPPSTAPVTASACSTVPSPIVQKLSLGMSVADVYTKLGRPVVAKPLNQSIDTTYAAFKGKGLRSLFLVFYKKQLYRLVANYDSSIRWRDRSEFEQAIIKALRLPLGAFSNTRKQFTCTNFEVTTNEQVGYYSLTLEDPSAYDKMYTELIIKGRARQAQEDKKKREFKP